MSLEDAPERKLKIEEHKEHEELSIDDKEKLNSLLESETRETVEAVESVQEKIEEMGGYEEILERAKDLREQADEEFLKAGGYLAVTGPTTIFFWQALERKDYVTAAICSLPILITSPNIIKGIKLKLESEGFLNWFKKKEKEFVPRITEWK